MISLFVIWTFVVIYLLWVHITAAFSEPPVPLRETITPCLMAIILGAGLTAAVILRDGSPLLTRLDADATMVRP